MWHEYRKHHGWRHHSWGRHGWHGGAFFFPPFLLLFLGFFLVFFIFKTGLWLPILLVGGFLWMTRRSSGGWGRDYRRDWNDEKPKRGDWGDGYHRHPYYEKPKRDDTEYV